MATVDLCDTIVNLLEFLVIRNVEAYKRALALAFLEWLRFRGYGDLCQAAYTDEWQFFPAKPRGHALFINKRIRSEWNLTTLSRITARGEV